MKKIAALWLAILILIGLVQAVTWFGEVASYAMVWNHHIIWLFIVGVPVITLVFQWRKRGTNCRAKKQ